jgi:hypothetical protein
MPTRSSASDHASTNNFLCRCGNLLNLHNLWCLVDTRDQYTDGSRFCAARLKRAKSGSGALKARKRLPADVRFEYQVLYGPAWEEKLTLPAGTPPEKAKAEHAAWLAQVEGRAV